MRNFLVSAALIATMVAQSGCYTVRYFDNNGAASGETRKVWVHTLIGGLVPLNDVLIDQQCPNGVTQIQSSLGILGIVASAITSGIYVPMTVKLTCVAGGKAELDQDLPGDWALAPAHGGAADVSAPMVYAE